MMQNPHRGDFAFSGSSTIQSDVPMVFAWIQIVLGCWVIASPWIFGVGVDMVFAWSNVVAGLAVALLGAWELFGNERK